MTAVLERPPVATHCEGCTKPLPTVRRRDTRYCNDRCRLAARAARHARLRDATPLPPEPDPTPTPTPRGALCRAATVPARYGRIPLAGQRVVIAAVDGDRATVVGRAVVGPGAGRITRCTVDLSILTVLPPEYRVRPCTSPCGDTGTCWTATRPDLPDAHHDALDGALIACHAHAAGKARL